VAASAKPTRAMTAGAAAEAGRPGRSSRSGGTPLGTAPTSAIEMTPATLSSSAPTAEQGAGEPGASSAGRAGDADHRHADPDGHRIPLPRRGQRLSGGHDGAPGVAARVEQGGDLRDASTDGALCEAVRTPAQAAVGRRGDRPGLPVHAGQRTDAFLAWIRTSLALTAAGAAVTSLLPQPIPRSRIAAVLNAGSGSASCVSSGRPGRPG